MSDLIDRDAAIDALGEAPKYKQRIVKTYAEGRNDQWFDDVTKLSLLPPTQPERKKGHWIRHITTGLGPKLNDTIECSECKIAFLTENMFRRSFCPNCGADMRGESDE